MNMWISSEALGIKSNSCIKKEYCGIRSNSEISWILNIVCWAEGGECFSFPYIVYDVWWRDCSFFNYIIFFNIYFAYSVNDRNNIRF